MARPFGAGTSFDSQVQEVAGWCPGRFERPTNRFVVKGQDLEWLQERVDFTACGLRPDTLPCAEPELRNRDDCYAEILRDAFPQLVDDTTPLLQREDAGVRIEEVFHRSSRSIVLPPDGNGCTSSRCLEYLPQLFQ